MAQARTTENNLQTHVEGVGGFRAVGVHCGLRTRGALDLALIVADSDCQAAGIFTTNQVKSSHVRYDTGILAEHRERIRAVVVNSKIANVCTGEQGAQNTARMAELVAAQLGCDSTQVLVMSTGIIGMQLPMHKIERGIEAAANSLGNDGKSWNTAALAIMTTDTRPKMASLRCNGYSIAGVAKGSGMIAPNMATMLSTLVTDAAIPAPDLQAVLRRVGDLTYNRITVDGDTSTSDTVLALANGHSGVRIGQDEPLAVFEANLLRVCKFLAREIVRDGEGASKFIAIEVVGAASDEAAGQIAKSIANSPLVKTAFAGADANWGAHYDGRRAAGVPFDQDQASLWFDYGGEGTTEAGLQVLAQGTPTHYLEADAADIFAAHEISVKLKLGEGAGQATVWTCDLGYEYVRINADYRS
ncbi:MAG: bifunctional glutamate N-acetyltransferase/amino-acid acetyltransferase ArgJ [Anaerolineae bacterium]|nr:bifunctional glutamate N-acetyltransferase/amino-acid acetyltransferase ArgJ [Anaerolineae bacterium]